MIKAKKAASLWRRLFLGMKYALLYAYQGGCAISLLDIDIFYQFSKIVAL